jgi:hypothetical protein
MRDLDVAYFEQRAAAAVELAQRATCRAAVRAHYEMSKAYLDTAEMLKAPIAEARAA